ncbi:unnamed protein product [Lymnaea stagnalis]|uniref:SCP domain-containing protein n=1 Tax=Lymnaea stagnalis TaxID=6523 RepID=A0AAV2HTC5_LYMST
MMSSVLLILTVCLSGYAAGLEALSQSVITAFLSGHNRMRSALNLPDLVWNSTLVSVAKSHVVDCHYIKIEDGNFDISPRKERDNVDIANDAMTMWSWEVNNLDPKWACIYNWSCKRYSQVVWRKTKSVGCAIVHCSRYDVNLLKCEYYPPGNVVGEIPY